MKVERVGRWRARGQGGDAEVGGVRAGAMHRCIGESSHYCGLLRPLLHACSWLGRRPRASLQVPWGRAEGAGAGACLHLAQTGEGCGCGWAGETGALADTELGDGVEVDEVE